MITVDFSELHALVNKLTHNIDELPDTIGQSVGPLIITNSIRNILTSTDIMGNPFVKLKHSNRRPLIRTGAMSKRSSFIVEITPDEIVVKNLEVYSIYHQLGTSRIPARTFMGLPRGLRLADITVSQIM